MRTLYRPVIFRRRVVKVALHAQCSNNESVSQVGRYCATSTQKAINYYEYRCGFTRALLKSAHEFQRCVYFDRCYHDIDLT